MLEVLHDINRKPAQPGYSTQKGLSCRPIHSSYHYIFVSPYVLPSSGKYILIFWVRKLPD